MDNKLILGFSKPFMDATRLVFETMVFTQVNIDKVEIKKNEACRGDFSSVMGVTGLYKTENIEKKIQGIFAITWNTDVYLKMSSLMLGETFTEFNSEIKDVGLEISNMIMGNAKKVLNPMGFLLNMSIASLVSGKDHALGYPDEAINLIFNISSPIGGFNMEISISFTD